MAIGDHPNRIWDLIDEVRDVIEKTTLRTGWSKKRILKSLEISESTYYRVLRYKGFNIKPKKKNVYEILPEEREKIIQYAIDNPNPRHRELTYKMIDEGVVCVSPSTVYRVLDEAGLIPNWPEQTDEKQEGNGVIERATKPDEKWQTDLSFIYIKDRWWFLISFIDEYSRYITHWELVWSMDTNTIISEAEKALSKLEFAGRNGHPAIQTDNGPVFIAREFKRYLSFKGISHKRIHPHTPEQNGIIERSFRTIKEVTGNRFDNLEEARKIIGEMIDYYNNERLHSSLYYLRPIDYYRGNPMELLEARREKVAYAKERRKQINLGIKQSSFCSHEVAA